MLQGMQHLPPKCTKVSKVTVIRSTNMLVQSVSYTESVNCWDKHQLCFLPLLLHQSYLVVCGATGAQKPVLLLGWGLVCGSEDRRTGWPQQNSHLVVPPENSHTAHHDPTFSLRSGRSSALRENKNKKRSFRLEHHKHGLFIIIIYIWHGKRKICHMQKRHQCYRPKK